MGGSKVKGLVGPDGRKITYNGKPLSYLPDNYQMSAAQLNGAAYQHYLTNLMDIALAVFEWEGMPEGVDTRMLEFFLLCRNFCVFFYDEGLVGSDEAPEGYAVLPAILQGGFDLYGYPQDRQAYSLDVEHTNIPLDETDSVLVFNSQLRVPMLPSIEWYAYRIANADRVVDINLANQKTAKVAAVNPKTKLTLSNIVSAYEDNQATIFTSDSLDLDKTLTVLDLSAPYVANDVLDVRNQLWNQALTFIGVENVNTDKKERLVSSEVAGNMGGIEAQRFTRLAARQQAADKINEKFGLNVSVKFRQGQYIQADGTNGGGAYAQDESGDEL